MEIPYTNPEQNQEQKNVSIVSFIVGQEHKSNSIGANRDYLTLASISIIIALFHSLAIGFIIQLHIDQLMISMVVFLLCFVLIVLFNRVYFVFKNKQAKGSILLTFIYVLFYLMLSFTVVPQVFKYYYLLDEVLKVTTGDSPLKHFSALVKVNQKLSLNERKSLNDFSLLSEGLSTLFSMLGAIVCHFIHANTKNETEIQSETLRKKLEQELLLKKQEYAYLFSTESKRVKSSKDDPFAQDDPTESDEDLNARKAELLTEIIHLQQTINNII